MTLDAFRILHDSVALEAFIDAHPTWGTMDFVNSLGCAYSTFERACKKFDLWGKIDHYTSSLETEIQTLLSSWGVETQKIARFAGPYEADLVVSDSLAIEVNGTYWHSEEHKAQRYHQRKSQEAEKQGAFIYHIFEFEWKDEHKRKRIKSQLKNLLGLKTETVGARKCEVISLSAQESRAFLHDNHMQGADASSIRLGLKYKDRLVAVMTFARPRFTKKYQWELSRFATCEETRVPGGASRLFKHFVRKYDPESVVSYSDAARTRGTLYETLGFEYTHWSNPNYVWIKGNDVVPRYQTQMKGETEIMKSAGYLRVFDSGNKVWVWKKNKTPTTDGV